MTINEWIAQSFQGNEVVFDGADAWGNQEIVRAYFPVDRGGEMFVLCGGQVVIGFELARVGGKRWPVYLTIQAPHYRSEGDKRPVTDTRPRLALVQSA